MQITITLNTDSDTSGAIKSHIEGDELAMVLFRINEIIYSDRKPLVKITAIKKRLHALGDISEYI